MTGSIEMSSKHEKDWKRLAAEYPALEPKEAMRIDGEHRILIQGKKTKKKTPFERFIDKQGYSEIYFIDRINKKRACDD